MTSIKQRKQALRREVLERRRDLSDKAHRSQRIVDRLAALREFGRAATTMFYLDARSEVRTQSAVSELLGGSKRIVVPYCVDDRLELCRLESLDEVASGEFGIPEPTAALRNDPDRQVDVRDVDLFVVPGVVFDRRGGRMGHGYGFFDRLLSDRHPDSVMIGVAYACQIVDDLPLEPHDVRLDMVVTEQAIWPASRVG